MWVTVRWIWHVPTTKAARGGGPGSCPHLVLHWAGGHFLSLFLFAAVWGLGKARSDPVESSAGQGFSLIPLLTDLGSFWQEELIPEAGGCPNSEGKAAVGMGEGRRPH